jgi:hypothetical protein
MRRRKFEKTNQLAAALEGRAGDNLAGYVAERLVSEKFVPTGDSDWDIQKSIEARAYSNWLLSDEGRKIASCLTSDGHFQSVDQTRAIFLTRFHTIPAVSLMPRDTLLPMPEEKPTERGDAWEGADYVPAAPPRTFDDAPPPMED